MFKKLTIGLIMSLVSFTAMAYEPSPPADQCFEPTVVKKRNNSNFRSYGAFGIDVQYLKVTKNDKCFVKLSDGDMKQMFIDQDIRKTFQNLGPIEGYGSYTIAGIPPKEPNILYKLESNHIIVNYREGIPSDLVRFEMLRNDVRKPERDFNILLRMKTPNAAGVPEYYNFTVSDTFMAGEYNYFLFSQGEYIIFVNVYPVKYPIPKR